VRPYLAVIVAALLQAAVPSTARADLELGILSYDVFIPGVPGSPGVNAFDIANLTGDPAVGGYALPPTFPVLTSVTFLNSSLALTSNGSTTTVMLGDIGPGFFSSPLLEFPDTESFSLAIFSATLDVTTFSVAAGDAASVATPLVVTSLLPSTGGNLVADTDFALIGVSPVVSGVPEPFSLALLATVVLLCLHRLRAGA
jgi:hypothetical protein